MDSGAPSVANRRRGRLEKPLITASSVRCRAAGVHRGYRGNGYNTEKRSNGAAQRKSAIRRRRPAKPARVGERHDPRENESGVIWADSFSRGSCRSARRFAARRRIAYLRVASVAPLLRVNPFPPSAPLPPVCREVTKVDRCGAIGVKFATERGGRNASIRPSDVHRRRGVVDRPERVGANNRRCRRRERYERCGAPGR